VRSDDQHVCAGDNLAWLLGELRNACPRCEMLAPGLTEDRDAMRRTLSGSESERAAVALPVVGSGEPIRPCPVCGTPLRGRQTSACSDKCRAVKSHGQRVPLPVAEARAIRADLTRALEAVWGAKATLEKYGGGTGWPFALAEEGGTRILQRLAAG